MTDHKTPPSLVPPRLPRMHRQPCGKIETELARTLYDLRNEMQEVLRTGIVPEDGGHPLGDPERTMIESWVERYLK